MNSKKKRVSVKDTLSKKVYLAGSCEAVSKDKRSEWRYYCESWFKENADGFTTINPVAFYDYDCCNHNTDSEVFRFFHRKVKEADVVLVNLENIRQSVGTICELAWAYDHGIPIIGFYTDGVVKHYSILEDQNIQRGIFHSWVVEICDRIECGISSMNEAMKYIRDYYYE